MLAKAGAATIGGALVVMLLVAAVVHGLFGSLSGHTASSADCDQPIADIPQDYCHLYVRAAHECPGLDWSILAAIGKIESDHGRSSLPGVADGTENAYHARGPMQFLQPTFDAVVARHPLPPGGRNPPSPWNKHDAIHAAAYYLCDSGAPKDIRKALWAYNHADWYVNEVLEQARKYSQAAPTGSIACSTFRSTVQESAQDLRRSPALVAVRFACAHLGQPYVWGG